MKHFLLSKVSKKKTKNRWGAVGVEVRGGLLTDFASRVFALSIHLGSFFSLSCKKTQHPTTSVIGIKCNSCFCRRSKVKCHIERRGRGGVSGDIKKGLRSEGPPAGHSPRGMAKTTSGQRGDLGSQVCSHEGTSVGRECNQPTRIIGY